MQPEALAELASRSPDDVLGPGAPELFEPSSLVERLRAVAAQLATMPTADIVAALVEVGRAWSASSYLPRQLAQAGIERGTGFPRETVAEALDAVARQLTRSELRAAIDAGVGDPAYLDGFRRRGDVLSRAFGPRVTVAFVGGWAPALSSVNIVEALLCKSSILFRLSADEPGFVPLLSASLADVDPILGAAVQPVWWPRERLDLTRALVGSADALLAFGDRATTDLLVADAPARCRVVVRGPRAGIGFVDRSELGAARLERVALAIADDITFGDQLSCLAPHVVYVDGAADRARALADALSARLEQLETDRPRRQPSLADAVGIRHFVARHRFRAWTSDGDAPVRSTGSRDLSWFVAVDDDPSVDPGPGYRCVRLCPVDGVGPVLDAIERRAPLISTVGLAAAPERWCAVGTSFARHHVSRVCELGSMHEPHFSWLHDGSSGIGSLVHWVDVEPPSA